MKRASWAGRPAFVTGASSKGTFVRVLRPPIEEMLKGEARTSEIISGCG